MTGLKQMKNILVPVNSEESILRLLPEQCKCLSNKCQPRRDIDKQKDGHNEIEDQANDLEETLVEFVVFQQVVDWGYNQWDGSDFQRRCTPEMLFECSRVGKVPTNAVETAKDDAEECEDNHPRVLVTLSGRCIE